MCWAVEVGAFIDSVTERPGMFTVDRWASFVICAIILIAPPFFCSSDRHFDNIQIAKDGEVLMHIDFGMILGENPAFKTPRFSISGAQEKAFKEVKIWEPFVEVCGQAYLSLRSRSAELMRLVALVLHHAGRPRAKILKYLASKSSLNIDEDNEEKAAKFVCDQVRSSSTNWELILRKFTHDRVDPLFFKAVEAAPAGLVAAVEKLYDKS